MKFTDYLGIKTPVVCAPMAGVTGPELAVEVRAGGGFGWLQMGHSGFDVLQSDLAKTRQLFRIHPILSSSSVSDTSRLPMGIGFFGFRLNATPIQEAIKLLHHAIDFTQAIWLSLGDGIERWIKEVRNYGGGEYPIFVMVNTEAEAIEAYNAGADVVVVQGIEAGGHGSSTAPSLLSLLPTIVTFFSLQPPRPSSIASTTPKPYILAAGGICIGSQIASCLAMGADGVVMGTRFLMTLEAKYSDAQKERLRVTKETIRTMAYDECRGTLEWPKGVNGRGIINKTVEEAQEGVEVNELKEKYQAAVKTGDVDRIVTWAGTSIGLCTKIQPAAEVVQELDREIREALQQGKAQL